MDISEKKREDEKEGEGGGGAGDEETSPMEELLVLRSLTGFHLLMEMDLKRPQKDKGPLGAW
jgi:hypothetical protein